MELPAELDRNVRRGLRRVLAGTAGWLLALAVSMVASARAAEERGATSLDIGGEVNRPRQCFAVCVGIDKYLDGCGYGTLKYAGRDAIGVAEALLGSCKFDRVLLLTDADVPQSLRQTYPEPRLTVVRDVSRNAVRDNAEPLFQQATGADDLVLFYFAGHGDAKPSAHLIAGDYHQQKDPAKTLSLSSIFDWVLTGAAKASNRFFIFDACRASPDGQAGAAMNPNFLLGLTYPQHRLTVFSGCSASQSAIEDDQLQHGRFTATLIDALGGAAFKQGEQNLLVSHVVEYVTGQFEKKPGWSSQTPREISSADRFFSLAHRDLPAAAPALAPAPAKAVERAIVERLHKDAVRHYLHNHLEEADALLESGASVLDSVASAEASTRQFCGQLRAERARVLYRLGRRDDWLRQAGLAEKMSPEEPVLRELTGYQLIADREFAKAKTLLADALAQRADDEQTAPYLLSQFGVALFNEKEFAAASDAFEKAAVRSVSLERLENAAANYDRAAVCCLKTGDAQKAHQLANRAFELVGKVRQGKPTADKADLIEQLSRVIDNLGDRKDATNACESSLAMRKQAQGESHPGVAHALTTLAQFQAAGGDYQQADKLLHEALAVREEAFGKDDLAVADSLTQIAVLHQSLGEFDRAEPLFKQALGICEQAFGKKDRDRAASLDHLAKQYNSKNQLSQFAAMVVEYYNAAGSLNDVSDAIRFAANADRLPQVARRLSTQLANIAIERGYRTLEISPFSVARRQGDDVAADVGTLGKLCAAELQRQLVAAYGDKFNVVVRNADEKAGANVDAFIAGTIGNRAGADVDLQCRLVATSGEQLAAVRDTAKLTESEWALLGASARIKSPDAPEERDLRHGVDQLDMLAQSAHPMASPDCPYKVYIIVDGKKIPGHFQGNDLIVPVRPGQKFEVQIENNSGEPAPMRLLVDGRNSLPAVDRKKEFATETVGPRVSTDDARFWVLDPKKSKTSRVPGYVRAGGQSAKPFVFDNVKSLDPNGASRNDQLGLVTAVFYDQPKERHGHAVGTGDERTENLSTKPSAPPSKVRCIINIRCVDPDAAKTSK